MSNGTGAPASTQLEAYEPEDVRQLRADLDDAIDTMNWQRRVIGRYRSLVLVCQDQNRAPTAQEIFDAMSLEECRLAA